MGDKKRIFMVTVRNPKGIRPQWRPRHRLDDNIKIDLREKGWADLDWIHLAHERGQECALVNVVINLRV
jgi:hypothetical protein